MAHATARVLRVGLHDPEPLRVEGFLALFTHHSKLRFIPAPLSALADDTSLDLLLLGVGAAEEAFALVTTLRSLRPSLPVLVMGPPATEAAMLAAIRAGAKAYLEQTATPEQVESAIDAVLDGSIWMPRRVLAVFIDQANRRERNSSLVSEATRFTAREREVLHELVSGRTNPEIARALGIEERTVKAHVARLMRKAGVENRVALSVYAAKPEWGPSWSKQGQLASSFDPDCGGKIRSA